MKTLALNLLLLFVTAAPAQWHCYVRQGSHYFPISHGATATITPLYWTALLTQSGRHTNSVIEIGLAMERTGEFRYGGQGSWNKGTTPANVRLFFSTQPRYNLRRAGSHEDDYWWSTSGVPLATLTNAVLSATLTTENWSNASGHRATDRPEAFARATKHVRQWGVSFGGGSFYDVGIATSQGRVMIRVNREH